MQYRQRLVGGKLRFVKTLNYDDEMDDVAKSTKPAHPFDEEKEETPHPMTAQKVEREVESFHDMYDGMDETSSIDGGNPSTSYEKFRIGHNHFCVEDNTDDTISTISRTECDVLHSWKMLPSWMRRKAGLSRNDIMKRFGLGNSENHCDKENESCTTATASSASVSEFSRSTYYTKYESMTLPELMAKILYEELLDACGDIESIDETRLKTHRIVKEHQNEKIGLSFATNHDNGTVYIFGIKNGSKFLHTGLQVGSRVVSVNGSSVPKNPKKLMKLLKKARGELVLVVETPEENVKTLLEV